MAKTIKMNNVTVTSYFVPRGMKVTYQKVLGENGGTMLNGDLVEDVLAWKAKVSIPCMPLTEAQMADFLTKATADHPTLYYFDPRTNGYRTIHYMADVSEATFRGAGGTGTEYWTGYVLTAEETCEYAIITQPQSVTVAVGERCIFTIAVSGENITYRWQYSTNGGSSWSNSTAASGYTDTYNPLATDAYDGRLIRCRVSNGYQTIYSDVVSVTLTS